MAKHKAPALEIINVSDVGKKRPHNEDSTVSDIKLGLAVLADGMGGYKAGEVASAMAVTIVLDHVRQGLKHLEASAVDKASGTSHAARLLQEAVTLANSQIYHTATNEPQCNGMGTTVVCTLFHDAGITIAHVGDSRLYRIRGEQFQQVTSDHSLIQELIDRGFFTREEAQANTPKNLVTRALGIEEEVKVDVKEEATEAGDIYLLCSDGLNDMVNDEEIRLTISKYCVNLQKAAEDLVRQANERGGKDNISIIMIRPANGAKPK